MNKIFIKYFDLIRTIAAILIGFALSLLCILFISEEPGKAISTFMVGPFQSLRRFGTMLEFMIPITFTGLGMCLMMQVGEFNLIGEGIFSLTGAMVGLLTTKILPPGIPPILYPFILIVFAAVFGAAFALIPAFLRLKFNANIVVVTIMLNYVLYWASMYMLQYWMRDTKVTFLGSEKLPKNALISRMIPGTEVSWGLVLAVVAVLFIYWFLYRTTKGYEIRMTGSNRSFALYAGIGVTGSMILAQAMGGALAGMGSTIEILSRYDRFKWVALTNYGFDGMMVAVIARRNPALVPLGAFFLAYIRIGADLVGQTTDVPVQFVMVIQAIIIMLVAANMFLDNFRRKAVVKESTASLEGGKA